MTANTTRQQSRFSENVLSAPQLVSTELVRKSLHMLIALVPSIAASVGTAATLNLLVAGTLFYAFAEYVRLNGGSIVLVTNITLMASRPRDNGRFVAGPVTLAVGAMLSLLLYPSPAATIAIYALAFGDGMASLVGRSFGSIRIIKGKSLEGSLACLVAVFAVAYSIFHQVWPAAIVATVATLLELATGDDMDNVILPTGVGLVATLLMS